MKKNPQISQYIPWCREITSYKNSVKTVFMLWHLQTWPKLPSGRQKSRIKDIMWRTTLPIQIAFLSCTRPFINSALIVHSVTFLLGFTLGILSRIFHLTKNWWSFQACYDMCTQWHLVTRCGCYNHDIRINFNITKEPSLWSMPEVVCFMNFAPTEIRIYSSERAIYW